jgi:hypothetical protein
VQLGYAKPLLLETGLGEIKLEAFRASQKILQSSLDAYQTGASASCSWDRHLFTYEVAWREALPLPAATSTFAFPYYLKALCT